MQPLQPLQPQQPDIPPEFLTAIIIVIAVAVVIGLIIQILFLATLYRRLSQVQPRNREMQPGMVFLNLIPIVQIVWIFFTVTGIAASLRKEFLDRGYPTADEGFGRGVGLAYAILLFCCHIPVVNVFCGIPYLVCWIIYWVQISQYRARLAADTGFSQEDGESDRGYADDEVRREDDRFREGRA